MTECDDQRVTQAGSHYRSHNLVAQVESSRRATKTNQTAKANKLMIKNKGMPNAMDFLQSNSLANRPNDLCLLLIGCRPYASYAFSRIYHIFASIQTIVALTRAPSHLINATACLFKTIGIAPIALQSDPHLSC